MLRRWVSKLTGYRYTYRVELRYINKHNNTVFSITMSTLLTTPNYLNKVREIKKVLAKDLISRMPKHLLTNGTIRLEPIVYLGYLKGN